MKRVPWLGKRRFSLFLTCLLFILPAMTWVDRSWAEGISLSSSDEVATGGYYQLSWENGRDATAFQLQESRSAEFSQPKVIYQGGDLASVISGRSDGEYHYRIRQVDEEGKPATAWGEPLQVTVKHHSLGRAFVFFALGLVVFVITLVAILRGSRETPS